MWQEQPVGPVRFPCIPTEWASGSCSQPHSLVPIFFRLLRLWASLGVAKHPGAWKRNTCMLKSKGTQLAESIE